MKKYIPHLTDLGSVIVPALPLETDWVAARYNPVFLGLSCLAVARIVYLKIVKEKIWTLKSFFNAKKITAEDFLVYLFASGVFCLFFVKIHLWLYGPRDFRHLSMLTVIFSALFSLSQEIIFRGYLQVVFEKLFGNIFISIIVTNILFVAMHYFFGLRAGEYVLLSIAGLGFSYLYYKIPNLWLVGMFHFFTNITALHLVVFHTFKF